MISFYMETPSGFGVEYGWGGRTVDDANWQVTKHDRFSMWGHRRPEKPETEEEREAVRKFSPPPTRPPPPRRGRRAALVRLLGCRDRFETCPYGERGQRPIEARFPLSRE